MTRLPEDLLWELARLEEAQEDSAEPSRSPDLQDSFVPEAVLEAYRQGALSAEEELRVERSLAQSPAARERLALLAGVRPTPLSAAARRRFLRAAKSSGRALPKPAAPLREATWWLAAAAVLVILAGGAWLWRTGPVTETTLPGIDASIQGLALVRNGEAAPAAGRDFTTAEPDTAVTVGVDVHPPRAGLSAGLYVFWPERRAVVRLPLEATWENRGQARFRALARSMVGDEPGTYRLFAVVARAGALPPDRILALGEDPEVAFAGRDLKVEPLRLEIVHGAAPELSEDSPPWEERRP